MSLDVYLTMPNAQPLPAAGSGIFVRLNGATKEITREKWDRLYPGREPIVVQDTPETTNVYTRNITHNLGRMAKAAGIYDAMWGPDERGWTCARELIEPLRDGLAELQTEPDRFKALNPDNGWGDYDGLVEFVADYLGACLRWPNAEVSVSR